MDNAKLADEIDLSVKDAEQYGFHNIVLKNADALKIIAALRRGPERIDAKMADLLVDITWRKAVGQCINGICGLDGTTLGKSCGRLFISRERFDEHIAPLIRQQERPPSGEMVTIKILKEWERALDACVAALKDHEEAVPSATKSLHELRAMLSAAEAEGRKG